jgi:uroporphyrinogen-III decarboxylase
MWEYQPVDHVPIWLTVDFDPWGYSVQERFRSTTKQLAVQLASIDRTLESVPDDVIPVLQPSVASTNEIAAALGANLYWAENEAQGPYPSEPLVCSAGDIQALSAGAWLENPVVSQWLERIALFARQTEWPLALDLPGPTDTAQVLSNQVWFFESIITNPEAIQDLYHVVTGSTIELVELAIEAAGGPGLCSKWSGCLTNSIPTRRSYLVVSGSGSP